MPIIAYSGTYVSYNFTKGVRYLVELWGANGGSCRWGSEGGKGGYAYAKMLPTSNLTWYFYVGGCPDETNIGYNNYAGGWNGGGNGGAVGSLWERPYGATDYSDYHEVRPGAGGGGATDLRTSTSSSSPQSYKMLVAGGGGGSGGYGFPGGDAGQDGHQRPGTEYTGDYGEHGTLTFKQTEGGGGATETAAGKGGRAPYHPNFRKVYESDVNDWTCYCPSGGGGGGGYYGGGGGSSGTIMIYGSAFNGVAGSAGNASGVGGSGGSSTSSKTGYHNVDEGGGGGGGSDFYRDNQANFVEGTTYMRSGLRPRKPIDTLNGVASVYPVYSEPEIREIYKDGNYIVVIFGKSLNNNIEELFYFEGNSHKEERENVSIGNTYIEQDSFYHADYTVIKSNENKIIKIPIRKEHGDWVFTFSMNNGFSTAKKVYNYKVIQKAPVISFNSNNISTPLIQGQMLEDIYNIETEHNEIECRCETVLVVNGKDYATYSHERDNCTIDLPYTYNGVDGESYTLKIKARACQTAENSCGLETEVWSDWIESEEMIVNASRPAINTLEFSTNFKNRAIERCTKLNVAWFERVPQEVSNKQYRLMLFKDGDMIQSFDTNNTFKNIVLDYPLNSSYKFGISIISNGVLSEIAFSEEFYLTDITSQSISFTNDLMLSSNITQNIDRFEVYINNDLKLISRKNLNEQLPVVFFKNGNNNIEIKTYVTPNEYFSTNYALHIAYDESKLVSSEKVDIVSNISINDKDYEITELVGDKLIPIDLCEAEKHLYLNSIPNREVVETVTQKITIKKSDPSSTDKTSILEILGHIE